MSKTPLLSMSKPLMSSRSRWAIVCGWPAVFYYVPNTLHVILNPLACCFYPLILLCLLSFHMVLIAWHFTKLVSVFVCWLATIIHTIDDGNLSDVDVPFPLTPSWSRSPWGMKSDDVIWCLWCPKPLLMFLMSSLSYCVWLTSGTLVWQNTNS